MMCGWQDTSHPFLAIEHSGPVYSANTVSDALVHLLPLRHLGLGQRETLDHQDKCSGDTLMESRLVESLCYVL